MPLLGWQRDAYMPASAIYLASEAGLSNLAPASVSLIVASPSSLIRAMYPMWEPFVVTSKLYGWVIRGTGPLHLG